MSGSHMAQVINALVAWRRRHQYSLYGSYGAEGRYGTRCFYGPNAERNAARDRRIHAEQPVAAEDGFGQGN